MLFHKVRALEEERDPLEDQVNSLRDNVKDMYGEFVKEFREKQKLEHRLNDKSSMAHALQNENLSLRSENVMVKKDLHRLFNDIQLALGTIGYEKLVKAVQDLITKYTPKIDGKEKGSRKDQDDDEKKPRLGGGEGVGVAEDMIRQRDLLLKKSRAIAEANVHVNTERAMDFRRMTSENSQLISEMNNLRAEKKSFSRKVKELETRLMRAEREGKLNRSSSAPEFDPDKRGSQRGGNNMSQTGPVGAANTPYLRRKEVDESEVYRRTKQQGMNMLPPVVDGGSEGGRSQGRKLKAPQRRGSQGTIQEQRFRDVIGNVDADDRSMEQQGFHTSKLREQVGGATAGTTRPLPLVQEEAGAGAFSEDDGSFAESRIQQR